MSIYEPKELEESRCQYEIMRDMLDKLHAQGGNMDGVIVVTYTDGTKCIINNRKFLAGFAELKSFWQGKGE